MVAASRRAFRTVLGAFALGAFVVGTAVEAQEPQREPAETEEREAIEDLSSLSRLATTTARPLERLPSTVTIIPGDELRRSGVRFLPDALRGLPGVEVLRTSATEVSVNMRGYNAAPIASQGVMALVDGRQADNAYLGFPVWDSIPVDMNEIDRVEVLVGPGSFVYGPNAMHGVVNIVTKSPLSYDSDYLSMGAAAGSYGSTLSRLTSVRRGESFAVKTSLLWDDIDSFTSDSDGKDKTFGEVRFESLIDADDPLHRVDVTVNRSRQKYGILLPTLDVIPPSPGQVDADEAVVRAEYQNHGLRAQASWLDYTGAADFETVYAPFHLEMNTADLDLQYSTKAGEHHSLTSGTGIRMSRFDTFDRDVSMGSHQARNLWVFVQDEVDLSDSWFLTAGLRYDHHSVVGSNVAPRVALLWEFDKEVVDEQRVRTQSLRASYGQGFRYPSLSDLWFDLPVTLGPVTFPVLGNLDLEQEHIESYELAYTGTFGDTHLGATAFYNEVEDLIGFVATIPATRMNEDDERAYGLEVRADHPLGEGLVGFANYSNTHRDDRNGSIDLPPRNKGSLGLRASLDPEAPPRSDLGLHATLWMNYFDDTRLVNQEVDSYVLLNAYVGYGFKLGGPKDETTWRLYVQAFNLLDHDHFEHPDGDEYGAILMGGLEVVF